MMIRLFFSLITLLATLSLYAQADVQAAIDRVRSDSRYRWGEGRSASLDESLELARENLASKLRTVLVSESKLSNDDFSSTTTAVTAGTLENLSELYYNDGREYVALVYVSQADLDRAEKDRCDLIKDLIDRGKAQEEQVNISQALKYYVWALRLLNTFNDRIMLTANSAERDAKLWLSNHIPAMLDNISFEIPEEKIVENPEDIDRYVVTVLASYNGHPVSMLDVSYFNGDHTISPVHFKSGEGVLTFPNLLAMKNTSIRVLYDYAQEGRTFNPLLEAVYPKGFKRLPFDDRSSKKLPIAVAKEKLKQTVSLPEFEAAPAPTDAAALADAQPLYKAERKTIERPLADNAALYVDAMKRVEQAIRSKNYLSVKNDFTPEGFRIFELMMGSGAVTISKKDLNFEIQQSGDNIVGKYIPVAIRNGKHISKENIVFRFSPSDGKIRSVAYALTSRAENDIFREASWSLDSRYSLMQFMEDYQTAYALKRLDYIESIFSDNAVIITGTVKPNARKRIYNWSDMQGMAADNMVTYKQFTKESFLEKLKEDFRRKSYIQLTFEDTYISKVPNTENLIDNDVIWIELHQDYQSSNYNDKGYLALQINLRKSGSSINVRTWTPVFVPMNVLKESFPIGI